MKATGDVGLVNQWEKLVIWTTDIITIGFAHVTIDERFVLDWRHGWVFEQVGRVVRCCQLLNFFAVKLKLGNRFRQT